MSLSHVQFHFAGWAREVVDNLVSKYVTGTTQYCAQNQANGNGSSHAQSSRSQTNPGASDRSHHTSNGETPEGSDPSTVHIFGKLDVLSTVWTPHFPERSFYCSLRQDGEKLRVNLRLGYWPTRGREDSN